MIFCGVFNMSRKAGEVVDELENKGVEVEDAGALNVDGVVWYNDDDGCKFGVKEELNEGLIREYRILVEAGLVNNVLATNFVRNAKSYRRPGYRVGSAMKFEDIRRRFESESSSKIMNDVLRDIVGHITREFIGKCGNRVAYSEIIHADYIKSSEVGRLTDGIECVLRMEVVPDAPEVDIKDLVLVKYVVDVTDSDIDSIISTLRSETKDFVDSDAGYRVAKGDKVVIDFQGRLRHKLFKGGSGTGVALTIGEGRFLQDFEDAIEGCCVGDSKVATVKFPSNYPNQMLSGRDVEFTIHVRRVMRGEKISDDEKLAGANGVANFGALREKIRRNIESKAKDLSRFMLRKQLFDKLDEKYFFALPRSVVDNEKRQIAIKGEGSGDHDALLKEAERRVKLGLLLLKVGEDNAITPSESDLVTLISRRYSGTGVRLEELLRKLREDREFALVIKGQALEEKVSDYLIDKCPSQEQGVKLQDLEDMVHGL